MGFAGVSRSGFELFAFVAHGLHYADDGGQYSQGCARILAKALGLGGGVYGLAQAVACAGAIELFVG